MRSSELSGWVLIPKTNLLRDTQRKNIQREEGKDDVKRETKIGGRQPHLRALGAIRSWKRQENLP